ncbi:adenine-specific methyltransferase [Paramecium bursaria Chlorella virus NE-JV-1]|nr:adenine-specific methyltransferase [Paramecium bursaria Chlorella virus NE-JV-1]
MKPIVKWSGGKGDEISRFESHFPDDCSTYVEPFVGGGAVFFSIGNNFESKIICDVHEELIALYRTISDGNIGTIYDFMSSHPNDEETYYRVRAWKPTEQIDIACRFYYIRKTCFRGMSRYNKNGGFNVPFGRYKTCNYEALKDVAYEDLLKDTTVSMSSFENTFATYDDPSTFVFLDPPYDSTFTDYGYCKFGKDEHVRLAELFKKSKSKCLMVIGGTDFIRELYDGYIVGEYEKKYRFKILNGRVGDEINTKHLIIKNYA